MKKVNLLLRKCRSVSRHLGRTPSYACLRSMSIRDYPGLPHDGGIGAPPPSADQEEPGTAVYVGSTRKRYLIRPEYLSHPLLRALVDGPVEGGVIVVRCEVVLFEHLLWTLETADSNITPDSSKELAELYSL
ncbi:hypothetical protein MLD38_000395 [Melastoma candidum]|uniref:Uncharacterized protein n=1 Tax=Melastoma candidum TaxID=119954 RepID=A0ACB9S9P8_9MYRT|nr:hypothetical protein MLD38_000395 [Melastoma candidum]